MIKQGSKKYLKQIAKLWKEAFSEEKEDVYEFYNKVTPIENTIINVSFGRVVSMATVIPVNCKNLKGGYVYAVATKKKFRGQGRCSKILKYINEFKFDFTFLKPSEESLFKFYEKFGYTKELYIPDYKNIDLSDFEECSAKEYHTLRAKHLENFVEWDVNVIEYILTYAKAYKRGEEICIVQDGKILEYLGTNLANTEKFGLLRTDKEIDLYFNLALE